MTTKKEDREAFEARYAEICGIVSGRFRRVFFEHDGDGYDNQGVAFAWSLWQAALAQQEQDFPARYFASGPQGHAWFDDIALACSIIASFDKDDDWTITDTQLRQHILRLQPCGIAAKDGGSGHKADQQPVGVDGLMQLARNWCLAWGEWAHDADPGCAKENAAEAALRDAILRTLAQQPAACPKCGGTGEADSGGIMPWGAPAMIPCDCKQPAAVDGEVVRRWDESANNDKSDSRREPEAASGWFCS